MASQVSLFTSAATAARSGSIGGSENWGTVANALVNNDTRAQFGTNLSIPWADGYSIYLTASELVSAVPAGATIDGIIVSIQRRTSAGGEEIALVDSRVSIIKDGSIGTTNKANATEYTNSDVSADYGGAAALWDETWTASEINASGFGVAISAGWAGMGAEDLGFPEIDFFTVEVFYTAAVAISELAGGESKPTRVVPLTNHRRRVLNPKGVIS